MLRDQRGQGRLGSILWLAVMAAGIFAAFRIIPVKIHVMDFHQFCDSQVQSLGTSYNINEKAFYESVLAKAKELNIPVDKKLMRLNVGSQDVQMTLQHRVTVDLEVYELVWDYDKTFKHLRM